MAAVLACGHGASLSHSSAAQARGFMPGTNVWVDVTVPTPGRRARTGIIVHTTRSLTPADVGAVDRIPCTSPSRTLVDLAEAVELRPLRRAVERADSLGLLDLWLIRETLGRLPGRHGHRRLGQVLAAYAGPSGTRSELEQRFLELMIGAGAVHPEVNVWLPDAAMEVDFLWREARLVVETDSREFHATPAALQRDVARDRRLHLAGYTPLRFTWHDVTRTPAETVSAVTRMLTRPSARR